VHFVGLFFVFASTLVFEGWRHQIPGSSGTLLQPPAATITSKTQGAQNIVFQQKLFKL